MTKNKKLHFPILLKVVLLGIITSFIAATTAIIVNYNNMINKAIRDLEESAIDALEYSYSFFDTSSSQGYNTIQSFNYVKDYLLPRYNDGLGVKDAKLDNYTSFEEYEKVFSSSFPYFYADDMFMTLDYPVFQENYNRINQILLNASFYSEQASYYAFKDEENPNRFVFLCDSRHQTKKWKGSFYHCPGSHYDLKEEDKISDIGHSYIKEYDLDEYHTRFIEIKTPNDEDVLETIGYMFIEYDTKNVTSSYQSILISEILILSATSLVIILIYALVSYLMFVRNINRLNKAAISISDKLGTGEEFAVIDPGINSRDEIKTLNNSFVAMENQIVNYVDIIQASAREKERMNAELEVASKIQLEALPKSSFNDEKISLRAFIKPAKEVGGDFYDYFYVNDNQLVIIISDVSGKGVPASLFMMKSKELIKSKMLSGSSLVKAIEEANKILEKNNEESLFVTSFIGVIEFDKNIIRYVNAGHEKPYIISQGEIIKLDGPSNYVLGAVDDATFIEESHAFNKGDIIFMFTDGLNESINEKEEEFTYQRIENTLKESTGSSLDEYINNMISALSNFTMGQEAFDDVTILAMQLHDNQLSLSFDKKDISIIEEAVDSFENHFSYIDNEKKSKAGIVLDELLNNLVSYEKREDLHIDINFKVIKDELQIEIISNGDNYDPFVNNEEKYLEGFSHDIEEGGFGVSLVQTMSKKCSYSYKNKKSIIKLVL